MSQMCWSAVVVFFSLLADVGYAITDLDHHSQHYTIEVTAKGDSKDVVRSESAREVSLPPHMSVIMSRSEAVATSPKNHSAPARSESSVVREGASPAQAVMARSQMVSNRSEFIGSPSTLTVVAAQNMADDTGRLTTLAVGAGVTVALVCICSIPRRYIGETAGYIFGDLPVIASFAFLLIVAGVITTLTAQIRVASELSDKETSSTDEPGFLSGVLVDMMNGFIAFLIYVFFLNLAAFVTALVAADGTREYCCGRRSDKGVMPHGMEWILRIGLWLTALTSLLFSYIYLLISILLVSGFFICNSPPVVIGQITLLLRSLPLQAASFRNRTGNDITDNEVVEDLATFDILPYCDPLNALQTDVFFLFIGLLILVIGQTLMLGAFEKDSERIEALRRRQEEEAPHAALLDAYGRPQWSVGFLDCVKDPGICFMSFCCAGIRWADTISLAGVGYFWYGVIVFTLLATGLSATLSFLRFSDEATAFSDTAAINRSLFLGLISGGLFILLLGTLVYYRQKMRRRYGFEHGDCNTVLLDIVGYAVCMPCFIAQEALHTEYVLTGGDPSNPDKQAAAHGTMVMEAEAADLDGEWRLSDNGQKVATIKDDTIMWGLNDADGKTQPLRKTISLILETRLNGTGSMTQGQLAPNGTIHWRNGDIWVKDSSYKPIITNESASDIDLCGEWLHTASNRKVATIQGKGKLNCCWNNGQTTMLKTMFAVSCEVDTETDVIVGQLQPDQSLIWNDGDVWKKAPRM
jgi:Cys-rich protein (TIGR01571 family)